MAPLESKARPRTTRPHVVTQWQAEELWYKNADKPHSLESAIRGSDKHLKPNLYVTPHRKPNCIRQSPSLSLLAISPNERWDFGSIRHIRQSSKDETTPTSSVDSVFELPCGDVIASPNSSVHSSFIAELEDTSYAVPSLHTQPRGPRSPVTAPVVSPSTMEFKTAQITSRAIIKVVDETIAAIEDTNRQLLSRAMAAEQAAKRLQEQNLELQLKIKHYSQSQLRPKTAPSQPPSTRRPPPRHRAATTSNDQTPPLSVFNERGKTISRRQTKSLVPPPRLPSRPLSRPANIDLAPNPFDGSGFPSPLHPNQNDVQPPSQFSAASPCSLNACRHSHHHHHNHHHTRALSISTPIPGSVTRHEVTYAGTPISVPCAPRAEIISLDEARRRAGAGAKVVEMSPPRRKNGVTMTVNVTEKPLPPLGPMSPSVLRGVVEMSAGDEVEWVRHREGGPGGVGSSIEGEKEGRKRGFSGLFRRIH